MSYNGLTNQGLEYLTRCQVESKPVVFSKVKIGNGNIPMGSTGETTTDLYSFKKEIEILNKEQVENSIKMEILINNFDVLEEFYVKEIGVYVMDNDVEKLYWYINKDRPSPLPDKNTPAKHRYILHLETSQMESIILNYTGLDLMVDKEFVEKKFNEVKARVKTIQISNIESLKTRNLKVGDIVEVLGYYTAGDGAGHKRIIKAEDDGSGVQLSNNLWACIVHNGEVNVSWFGAKGDNENDDSIHIKKALMFAEIVNIGNGDFIINDLVIEKAWKCKEICGVDKDKTKLYGRITNNISKLNIKNIGVFGNKTGSGFKLLTATNIDNCQAYNHNIGLDISADVHVITSRITSCTFAYNKDVGVKIKASGYGQKNCIYLKDIYIVKNGTDVDNLTSPATTTDGHGLWIDGGYSITAVNITAEYNSGIGIYITADSYPLIGLTMLCPYMERNKYANMYIKHRRSKTRIEGLNILGEFISDAGYEPVENSIKERGVYIDEKVSLMNSYSNSFILGKYSPFNLQRERTKYLSYEGTPFFNIKDSSNYVDKNKKEIDGKTVFFLNKEIAGFKDNGDYIYLDTLYKYRLEFKAKSLNIPQRCGVYLQKAESGLNNVYLLADVTPDKWTKYSVDFNAIYDETVFYMCLLNPDSNNDEVYIKDIRITKLSPIEVTPAVALSTANTYQVEKMKQENVYNDYISYMDDKTAYDKQQEKFEKERQLAYQEALKENPNLTYEEFMSVQPMLLNIVEEPQPSKALLAFMEKYL